MRHRTPIPLGGAGGGGGKGSRSGLSPALLSSSTRGSSPRHVHFDDRRGDYADSYHDRPAAGSFCDEKEKAREKIREKMTTNRNKTTKKDDLTSEIDVRLCRYRELTRALAEKLSSPFPIAESRDDDSSEDDPNPGPNPNPSRTSVRTSSLTTTSGSARRESTEKGSLNSSRYMTEQRTINDTKRRVQLRVAGLPSLHQPPLSENQQKWGQGQKRGGSNLSISRRSQIQSGFGNRSCKNGIDYTETSMLLHSDPLFQEQRWRFRRRRRQFKRSKNSESRLEDSAEVGTSINKNYRKGGFGRSASAGSLGLKEFFARCKSPDIGGSGESLSCSSVDAYETRQRGLRVSGFSSPDPTPRHTCLPNHGFGQPPPSLTRKKNAGDNEFAPSPNDKAATPSPQIKLGNSHPGQKGEESNNIALPRKPSLLSRPPSPTLLPTPSRPASVSTLPDVTLNCDANLDFNQGGEVLSGIASSRRSNLLRMPPPVSSLTPSNRAGQFALPDSTVNEPSLPGGEQLNHLDNGKNDDGDDRHSVPFRMVRSESAKPRLERHAREYDHSDNGDYGDGIRCKGKCHGDDDDDGQDWYQSATVLHLLIKRGDWDGLVMRLGTHPAEAGMWAVAERTRRNDTSEDVVSPPFSDSLFSSFSLSGPSVMLYMAAAVARRIASRRGGPGRRMLPLHQSVPSLLQLHYHLQACDMCPPEPVVKSLLLAHPLAATIQDSDGNLPLHLACWSLSSCDVVDALLLADIDAAREVNAEMRLPLHLACRRGADLEVIKSLLVAHHRAVERTDHYGMVPLHYACANGASLEVVKVLLRAYLRAAEVRNGWGRTPLDLLLNDPEAGERTSAATNSRDGSGGTSSSSLKVVENRGNVDHNHDHGGSSERERITEASQRDVHHWAVAAPSFDGYDADGIEYSVGTHGRDTRDAAGGSKRLTSTEEEIRRAVGPASVVGHGIAETWEKKIGALKSSSKDSSPTTNTASAVQTSKNSSSRQIDDEEEEIVPLTHILSLKADHPPYKEMERHLEPQPQSTRRRFVAETESIVNEAESITSLSQLNMEGGEVLSSLEEDGYLNEKRSVAVRRQRGRPSRHRISSRIEWRGGAASKSKPRKKSNILHLEFKLAEVMAASATAAMSFQEMRDSLEADNIRLRGKVNELTPRLEQSEVRLKQWEERVGYLEEEFDDVFCCKMNLRKVC